MLKRKNSGILFRLAMLYYALELMLTKVGVKQLAVQKTRLRYKLWWVDLIQLLIDIKAITFYSDNAVTVSWG
jgi:hypothetical protein